MTNTKKIWEGVREARQPYLNGTIGKCVRLSAERFCFSEESVNVRIKVVLTIKTFVIAQSQFASC